jgi:hypothetical protein
MNDVCLQTHWLPGWRPFHTNLLVFSSQTDYQLSSNLVSLITPRHGPCIEHSSPIVPQSSPWEDACPRRRHPATAAYIFLLEICCLTANVVSLSVSKSLPSNGSTRYNMRNIKVQPVPDTESPRARSEA